MKTMKSIFMMAAAIAAVSCAQEIMPEGVTGNTDNTVNVELQPMTFSAISSDESKAVLDNRSIQWQSGDAISVFDGSGNRKFTTTDNGSKATFEGLAAVAEEYYAIYPYQENAVFTATGTVNGSDFENYISMTIPTEQTATAGSFDPKAFLSISKVDAEGNLRFNNLLGLVQFKLADAANVASVTLSGNNSEQLAGDIYAYYTAEGNQKNTYGAATSKLVTLKGEFVADTDYYFAVRPCGFEQGLTISVEYKDGETVTRKYLSSTKAPSKVLTAGSMMKLGTLDNLKEGTPNDLFIAYQHGFDLTFGDQLINKATFGEANLVKTAGSRISTNDVYFIDPAISDVTLSNPASEEEYGRVVVIGRYKDQRSKLTRANVYYFHSTGNNDDLFLMANIDYEGTTTSKYLFYNKFTTPQEKVIFDNCKLKSTAGGAGVKDYIQIGSAAPISNIQIVNCDIEAAGDTHNLITLGKNVICNSIELKNNIFLNPDYENTKTIFQCITINKTGSKLSKLILDSNTFMHTYTNSNGYVYVQGEQIGDFTITYNLFYLPSHSSGYHNIVDYNHTEATQIFNNNACVIAEGAAGQIQMPTKEFKEGCEQVLVFKGVNPFETEDYENVVFIPTSEYSTYGAKR